MGMFLQQLPALIGVLVGTLGTILATTIADRERWRRSKRVRWDEKRLEAYLDYALTLKEIHILSLRLAADRIHNLHPIEHEDGLAKLAEADLRRAKAWERMLLLGDATTVSAARAWREAVWQVQYLAREATGDAAAFQELVGRANEARDRFYDAARNGLEVAAGSVAQSAWLAEAIGQRVDSVIENHRSPERTGLAE